MGHLLNSERRVNALYGELHHLDANGVVRDTKNFLQMVSGEIVSRPQGGRMLFTVLMSVSFTAPFLATILKVAAPEATMTPNESIRWSVNSVLVGSVLVAAYAYLTLKRTPNAQRGSFWTVGHTLTLAVVAFVGDA